ncbi:FUSC family protein [Hespellia stercorisuis]|uniref:Aromatic acid exporter family member 1 n=1 Tax=Hespellia stercorisuis DSM 15480 TaxID=1121950 RepID=A0A1M6PIV9_9FIRM|nr:aromatic acid exporter family protein [Hespellia stercorisuis]SHK07895.1 Aromatic acid exporter family member 1 [Hespellia stercorisuis DSM 15480]
MKKHPIKIGRRIWKTVIAVYVCFFIDTVRGAGVPFYAAIAAILCMQRNKHESLQTAKNREIATILGGFCGLLFLIFEQYVYHFSVILIRYAVLSVLLIPIIQISLWLHQEKGTFLMCVVFLCVTVTHAGDINPVSFAGNRIIDTTIGIVVALIVNFRDVSNTNS